MVDQTNRQAVQDEVDLRQLILSIWDGRWLIGGVTGLALLLGVGVAVLSPKKFSATMDILPMSVFDEDAYRSLAELEIIQVSREAILADFIERLLDGDLFEKAMQETGYISRNEFSSDENFRKALRKAAFGIKLLPPTDTSLLSTTLARDRFFNWRLQAEGHNSEKFIQSLQIAFNLASSDVRLGLKRRFEAEIAARRRMSEYQIDDLRRAIANALDDYERNTQNRLNFLTEQAQIARALDIAKNTIAAQSFAASNSVVTNIAAETPFFMRGYQAIEKEMELIESRSNIKAFIPELAELESKLREAEQNPLIKRAENAFNLTPISTGERFRPARADVAAITLTPLSSSAITIALAGLLGGFSGLLLLFLRNILRARG